MKSRWWVVVGAGTRRFPWNWHWCRNDDTGAGAPSRCTAFGHRFFHSIRSQCSELIALVRQIEMATVSNVNFPQVDLQLANNALPKPTELYLPNVEMQSIISKLHCLAFLSHSFRIAALRLLPERNTIHVVGLLLLLNKQSNVGAQSSTMNKMFTFSKWIGRFVINNAIC